MADIVAVNGRMALWKVAREVMRWGKEVSPRGQLTREVRGLSVEIDDPYDTLCTGMSANQSLEVAACEAIQLIGCFSDPQFAITHAPKLANFVNAAGYFDGAYGPRVEPLMSTLLLRLTKDPDTRQAIIPVWNAADLTRWGSLDYPCTLSLAFFIRNDKLELDVVMRSNDVNWGFKNDIFQFTQLQVSIANLLGIAAGTYRHTAHSMHLYERDWSWAEGLGVGRDMTDTLPDHPRGVDGATQLVEMQNRAKAIAFVEPEHFIEAEATPSELWYRRALWP